MRFKIQTLNNISIKGLERLPRDRFEVASEINNPDAILVRSADMHKLALPDSLRAVGRAGAGTNNIPVEALSKKGIPVFNAPGANANAVKELVLAGMFLAARNITREELDRLKIIVCDQERRILAGSEDSELDAAFHLGLATASKNRIVKQVMDTVSGILDESRQESLWNETRRKASIVGHLKIIDALESRDPDMAFEAMKEHLSSIERIVLGDEGMSAPGKGEGSAS
jgi:hypothetical protein